MARDDVRAQLKRTIAQEQRRTDGTGRDWAVTGLMLLALGIALSGFRTVLQGGSWWMAAMLVATTVLLATAVIRSLVRFRLLALLAGAAAGAGMLTLLFAADVAWLGVIPNLQALQRFGELERAGGASIAGQGIPAQADDGITFLVCLGVAALAFAMELFATGARMPVLSGLSLLVVLLVPAIVDVGLHDPLTFVLTAAVYLGILLVSARRIRLRPALGVGAAALAATLLIPLGLPQVQPQALGGSGGGANTLNPIINLGNDLRRGDPEIAYTYTTSAEGGDYFRMTALDGFGGGAWSPVNRPDDGVELSALGGAPGLGDDVATASVTTDVVIGDVRSPWLPVPYAAQRIEGLEGSWRVDTDRLTIGTGDSDIEGQRYTVESAVPQPTVEQLRAAGDEVPTGFDRYTALPESIPDVVAETAEEVAGTAETNYDAALALQSYFQSGEFAYSEEAPVEGGYDGSGARILGDFLQIKAGYCVHFSSAMAAMARTLGIPSRVAVGFTAGTAVTQDGGQAYRVTTHDYHSWPELYFTGVGWVRFEPTPGRGDQPQFPLATQDDPATPDVDESAPVPPPAATPPTTAPTPTAVPEAATPDRELGGATPTAGTDQIGGWVALAVILALLAAPAAIRAVRRLRRYAAVRAGSGATAWAELQDTMLDLGRAVEPATTPRQFAQTLLDAGAPEDVTARLLAAIEHEAYAPTPQPPTTRDLRRARWALTEHAAFGTILLSIVWPRSLFAGWLPQHRIALAD